MFKKERKAVNRILGFVLASALLLSGCAAPPTGGIEVRDAWTRPAAQGGNGAIYFVIENHSAEMQEMIGVTSDIAEAVEMHESQMNGDVMEMRQLQSVPLESGEELVFEPGGLHIMLIDLKQDLKTGDQVQLTLHFANYEDMQLTVPVQDTPASDSEHSPNNH
jgi:copper(I)-binding protein